MNTFTYFPTTLQYWLGPISVATLSGGPLSIQSHAGLPKYWAPTGSRIIYIWLIYHKTKYKEMTWHTPFPIPALQHRTPAFYLQMFSFIVCPLFAGIYFELSSVWIVVWGLLWVISSQIRRYLQLEIIEIQPLLFNCAHQVSELSATDQTFRLESSEGQVIDNTFVLKSLLLLVKILTIKSKRILLPFMAGVSNWHHLYLTHVPMVSDYWLRPP